MSLLTLIIDITPNTWGHRGLVRSARDKALAAKNKPSAGPANLDDVLTAAITLGTSFSCLNRDNVLVVIAATEEEVSILYPRKGGEGNMEDVVMGTNTNRFDGGLFNDYIRLGVAELVNRAAERAEKREAQMEQIKAEHSNGGNAVDNSQNYLSQQQQQQQQQQKKGAAIASALSVALCTINRFLVASHAGVSALANASNIFQRRDDDGILALMGGSGSKKTQQEAANSKTNILSPRALIIQASSDRTSDYNALMNCAFASNKSNIVIDGCFIPSGTKEDAKSSPFLEQIVDQTNGLYLAVPSGAAQVGGALTEVFMSVFLPEPAIRGQMNLPKQNNVDFRARCFETGQSIDIAQICNQCLSVFKEKPKERCLTCGAVVKKKSSASKKMKLK